MAESRHARQRRRLDAAAAAVFARHGYAEATAEAIAREAGMSKATFYEHFANKEDCILALFDTAQQQVLGALARAGADEGLEPGERQRRSIAALLDAVAAHPGVAQTLLVEIIGAGPRAMARRDAAVAGFARYVAERNPRLAAPEDAFAIVGAIVELVSRQLRTGEPASVRDLEPVIERVVTGILAAGDRLPAATA
jgi:AcrR family transcriptional regulator